MKKEEKILPLNNSFCSPVSRSDGVDLSDDFVEVYELVDHAELGPSGEATDFVIKKIPVLTESYHLNKVIAERAKGTSLKEIVAQIERTGDDSILASRIVSYGDGTLTPKCLSDACDLASKGASILDSSSQEELAEALKISKMSDLEFSSYIKGLVDKRVNSVKEEDKNVDN